MAADPGSQTAPVPDESAVLPLSQQEDSTENPFLVVETGPPPEPGGGNDAPAPAVVPVSVEGNQPPPAYTEAIRRPVRRGNSGTAEVEVAPLLSRHSSASTLTEREPTAGDHVRQQRGAVRAILLWLGIGQWYSGLCIFFSFIFISGGIVLITLSFLTLDKLQPVKLTVIAAGIVFILLSLLWPCGWLWNQWNRTCGCSYAPFVAYAWALSLVYTAIVGALIFGVNEHYDCIHYCENCTFPVSERYPCEFVGMSLWTMLAMLGLMVVVVFISFCYCCYSNCSCKKERQGYTTL